MTNASANKSAPTPDQSQPEASPGQPLKDSLDDLTTAAEQLRSRIDWAEYPKLAAIFENRPSVNCYWHELVRLVTA